MLLNTHPTGCQSIQHNDHVSWPPYEPASAAPRNNIVRDSSRSHNDYANYITSDSTANSAASSELVTNQPSNVTPTSVWRQGRSKFNNSLSYSLAPNSIIRGVPRASPPPLQGSPGTHPIYSINPTLLTNSDGNHIR